MRRMVEKVPIFTGLMLAVAVKTCTATKEATKVFVVPTFLRRFSIVEKFSYHNKVLG